MRSIFVKMSSEVVEYLLELRVRLDKVVTNVESWVEESRISGSVRVVGRWGNEQVQEYPIVRVESHSLHHKFRYHG